jgi:alpha-N-arabinofuranosidase
MNENRFSSTLLEDLHRTGNEITARLRVDLKPCGSVIPKTIFGNFLEHLGFAIQGGVWAQELSNPVFSRETNLVPTHIAELLLAGGRLLELFQREGDQQGLPLNWTPGTDVTGFGVAALDDAVSSGIPFPWAPLSAPGCVCASVGRIGGAVRLMGTPWKGGTFPPEVSLDDGPSGIRQGIFPPVRRCLAYTGDIWTRIATLDPGAQGRIEVGFRRRLGRHGSLAGEILASEEIPVRGCEWEKLPFSLLFPQGSILPGEPVDFYLRWLPSQGQNLDLLVDQALLFPADALEGFDPEVVSLAKTWPVPLLRWPGGNFVSQYHWRDGVGPLDLRPTRPNAAWYGLEYNFIGTREFIHFCRLIGAEPQITVNTGTGTAEEAAAWVEFCNGDVSTPMGRLRAEQGDLEPYNVQLWEVGNEMYGCWQVGYFGSEENAHRYVEFARAMRAVDPKIELIATGNSFDFAEPGPGYDYTQADQRWHQKLIDLAGKELDIVSLHSLPVNDRFLERVTHEQAYYSLLAQPVIWERDFLPNLLRRFDQELPEHKPVRLAITEWGILGMRKDRPYVDTFGEAIYAALFLNLMIRNAERIPIANATALCHGGCIRKIAGKIYTDPQYLVTQQYAKLIGARPLACVLESPSRDIDTGTDLGRPEKNVPFVDAVVCLADEKDVEKPGLYLAIVNIHLSQLIEITVKFPSVSIDSIGNRTVLTYPDPLAKATLVEPNRFQMHYDSISAGNGEVKIALPPLSISWLQFPLMTSTRMLLPDQACDRRLK